MSKITIELPSYKQPKNYGKHVYQEWDSKGKYTYDAETGVYGYYRRLRFGSVVGYCDGHRASFCLRDTKGKEKASLNVKTRHLGGKGMVFRKLRPLRGLRAAENFLGAMQSPMFYTDSKELIVGEVNAVVSLFINMILQPWERNSFPSCSIETKQYDDCTPPYLTVLFPLLHSKHHAKAFMSPFRHSTEKHYKALRGLTSLSKLTKHFFGTDSATLNKLSQRILSEGLLDGCVGDIDFSHSIGFLEAGFSASDLLVIPACFYNHYSLPNALTRISLNKLLSLELSAKETYNKDCLSLLCALPEGMKVGKGIRNMTHLHEVLSYVVNRLRNDNYKLWTHPQFQGYEGTTVLDFEIVFPKTSNDLKEWGTSLGICIGGYGNRVHAGYSICFALYKHGKPVICVEINGDDFTLSQVYGRNNSDQPEYLWDALKDVLNLENCQYTPMTDWDRPKEKMFEEGMDPAFLYREAIYRTTRIEEWAYIMCAHENRPYCNMDDRLGGAQLMQVDQF